MARKLNSRSDYAIRTRSRLPAAPKHGIQPSAQPGAASETATRIEIEDLRLRVRTLNATNTNLRRKLKLLEARLHANADDKHGSIAKANAKH